MEADHLNESFTSENLAGLTLNELLAARGSLNTASFSIPPSMTIDSQTGVLVWTPALADFEEGLSAGDDFGVKEILIRVDDGNGGFDLQQFPITVYLPNNKPVITSDPPTQAVANLPYQYGVTAQDGDGDVLTYRLDVHPTGMTINPFTGQVNWTPASDDVGDHDVTLIASDGKDDTLQDVHDHRAAGGRQCLPAGVLDAAEPCATGQRVHLRGGSGRSRTAIRWRSGSTRLRRA